MQHRARLFVVPLLSLLALSPARATAQEIRRRAAAAHDVWSDPNSGVRYLHRTTTTPCEIHALLVDLRADGVRLVATPYDDRWSTVAEHARSRSLAAAVNGGFWGALQRPRGLAAGGGALWPSATTDPEMGFFAIDARGRPILRAPGEEVDERELASITEAVSGRPMLLDEGAIDQAVLDAFPTSNQRQPRTAIGLTEDRRTAIVVVVDGRRRSSRGMTLYELARLLAELGAHDALNLDGGGSSEMYVERAGGVVNVPSRGRWEIALDRALHGDEATRGADRSRAGPTGDEVFVRGVEREVLNHLGVIAPVPAALAPAPFDSALAGAPPSEPIRRAAPDVPRWRIGAWREVLADAITLAPGLAIAAIVVVAWRRRRRPCAASRGRGAGVRLADTER